MLRSRVLRMAVAAAAACAVAGVSPAQAQDDRAFEIGGQVTILRLSEFDTTDVGAGVHAGWRVSPLLVVDGALTWFPGGDDEPPSVDAQQKVLGLAGVRGGVRSGRVELFGRARPGFLRFAAEDSVPCILIFPPPLGCQVLSGRTSFVTEIGGGVRIGLDEANRMHLSFDISDLLVRYGGEAIRPDGDVTEDGFVSHNLMLGVGVHWSVP